MKKLSYLIVLIMALGLIVTGCIPVVPPSEQNELSSTVSKVIIVSEGGEEYINAITNGHKIKNKWDLKGSFVAHGGYNWGGLAEEGATWEYSIHIKEAMSGEFSVGSIRFTTGDIEVVGQVKQTARYYNYWSGDNIAAAGTAKYNDTTYYFLFLYAERAMWFALSETSYDLCWPDTVWGKGCEGSRAYQLHSIVDAGQFTLDYKLIHGEIIY